MSVFRRANQGGVTVLGFIIVGVILAALTLTGVYVLYQRGEQARKDAAIAVVDAQEQAAGENAPPDGQAPAPTPANNDKPAPTQPEPAQTPTVLPETGPTDNLVNVLIVAMLAISITAYVRSRRAASVTL